MLSFTFGVNADVLLNDYLPIFLGITFDIIVT